MTQESDAIWFPPKRYGWGWGLPVRWEGWVVLAVYVALLAVGVRYLFDAQALVSGFAYFLGITALLVLICYWKGAKPRWRWGGD